MCDMTHSCVRSDSFICVMWLLQMCDMTHSYVRHDSFIYATWLIHMCSVFRMHICHIWSHDSFTCAKIKVWHVSHYSHYLFKCIFLRLFWGLIVCGTCCTYMRHDSFTFKVWYVLHYSFKCTFMRNFWRLRVCGTCCTYMRHVWMSYGTRMNESWHTYEWVMAHIWMSHGTYIKENLDVREFFETRVWQNKLQKETGKGLGSRAQVSKRVA